jgi:hypothetical protein
VPRPTGLPENEFSRTLSGAEILQLLSHWLAHKVSFVTASLGSGESKTAEKVFAHAKCKPRALKRKSIFRD